MAIYHAHIKSFSRGKGESSLAAAAYRAGLDLIDTKTRDWHRYSQRRGVAGVHMLTPPGAPDWCRDPKTFWDANEQWETRANARVARELEVSLPFELSSEQREALAIELGQMLVDRYGCVVMVAIHEPVGGSDDRNHHTHLLMSARKVSGAGLGERAGAAFDARGGKGAEEIKTVRALVGRIINDHLTRAGLDQSVDHRSLKDQARAAAERGDALLAIRLTRPPTKHRGKVENALIKKEAAQLGAEAQMDQAIADAAARGALVMPSAGHSRAQAFADRVETRRTVIKPPILWGRDARPRRAGEPSAMALRLSRLGRIARSQGTAGADILNSEAELIEKWLDAMNEAAEEAMRQVHVIPGVRTEPEFDKAIESLRTRRVSVYGMAPFLYEDTEALSWAIQNYAAEIRRPHDNRERLRVAQVRVAEVECIAELSDKEAVLRARRELYKARRGVSRAAQIECERRFTQARTLMIAARAHLDKRFYMTPTAPLTADGTDPFEAMTGEGGARQSESHQRQLRPKPERSTRMGH